MEYTENTAVGCVIMASGRAVRFGSNKLLADFGGAPLIAQALDAAETPALAARVVVTRSPEVAELACKAGVKAILHSLPGRNDTVRLGLDAMESLYHRTPFRVRISSIRCSTPPKVLAISRMVS